VGARDTPANHRARIEDDTTSLDPVKPPPGKWFRADRPETPVETPVTIPQAENDTTNLCGGGQWSCEDP